MRISTRADLDESTLAVLRDIADATEVEVRTHLPTLEDQLRLVVQVGTQVIPETGEAAASIAPGVIAWTVDPGRPGGVTAIAQSHLRHTLFHEMHHLVRGWTFYGGAPSDSFMHGVVSEGLATAFARDAAGDDAPWGQYSADEACAWVAELRALPRDANYQQWMFQHPDGRRWIGYRAGTFIADEAIARGKTSAAALVETPWDGVLALSGL
jgi:hypothetical protein